MNIHRRITHGTEISRKLGSLTFYVVKEFCSVYNTKCLEINEIVTRPRSINYFNRRTTQKIPKRKTRSRNGNAKRRDVNQESRCVLRKLCNFNSATMTEIMSLLFRQHFRSVSQISHVTSTSLCFYLITLYNYVRTNV